MANVNIVRNGSNYSLSVSSETINKYSHYQHLRAFSTASGVSVKATLQGWNGKKWVRAKAKPGEKQS